MKARHAHFLWPHLLIHASAPTRLQYPSSALGGSGWRDSDGDLARSPLHGDGESARAGVPSHLAQLAAGGESLHQPLLLPSSPIHTFGGWQDWLQLTRHIK